MTGKDERSRARAEHRRLGEEIAGHDRAYYQNDAPVISDADYDALRRRYEALERQFPELADKDSLGRKFGAAPVEKFAKVTHAVPMLSLGNIFVDDELEDFVARVRRFLGLGGDAELAFTAEPKIDGLSCALRYERGLLISAATRGDRLAGEDVTANVRTIGDIPQQLAGDAPDIIDVCGDRRRARSAVGLRRDGHGIAGAQAPPLVWAVGIPKGGDRRQSLRGAVISIARHPCSIA